MSRVLVADDERAICTAFAQLLRDAGHEPLIAANGREALELVRSARPDAAFLDVRMPGMDGLQALAQIREIAPELPVVVMTAHGTMQTALEAMRLGALDYLGKPLELPRLRELLTRALAQAAKPPTGNAAALSETPGLLGQSPAMQEVFKLVGLLADNDLSVLITGESGVGKELVARAIHEHSGRAGAPWVAVNCAAIPENLLERELFGNERGAFTGADRRRIGRFEAAGAGTLFLDEIGELPAALQGKLLRVLQERSFERVGGVDPLPLAARVVAASNRDLGSEVASARFRGDLYYRLRLVSLRVPPLRERGNDILLLAHHFLAVANRELGRQVEGFAGDALALLKRHTWPGNVRELEHVIKHAVLLQRGPTLTANDLELEAVAGASNAPADPLADAARHALLHGLDSPPPAAGRYHHLVGVVEQALVAAALAQCNGNQVAAAELLGLHRTTLRRKAGLDGDE
jgi:DNA-binding NtrC family response regulator